MTEKKQCAKIYRLDELDYLKCVLIVLVVSFHLAYFSDCYPNAKQFVYTFHMPIFLFVSGYMINARGALRTTPRKLRWYLIPYILFEIPYIIMASILPIREHIDELSAGIFLSKLLFHPIGPYWYLHTLVLCGSVYLCTIYLVRIKFISQLILTGIIYFLCAYAGLVSLTMAFYFLAGVILRHNRINVLHFIQPSWMSIIAIILIINYSQNLNSSTTSGILTTYLVASLLLAVYGITRGRALKWMLFIGKHTFAIFLFSPVFTFLCKSVGWLFTFDKSGILFLVTSLTICIYGSLFLAKLSDVCGLSRFAFGKRLIVN